MSLKTSLACLYCAGETEWLLINGQTGYIGFTGRDSPDVKCLGKDANSGDLLNLPSFPGWPKPRLKGNAFPGCPVQQAETDCSLTL